VYDVTVPGVWQEAFVRLGRGLEREQRARDAVDAYAAEVALTKTRLAPVVARAPRITVIYPNYRGGGENFVFDAQFALAEVFVQLGFGLVGIEKAAEAFPGVGSISLERLGDFETDTIIALGPVDWRETPARSGPVQQRRAGARRAARRDPAVHRAPHLTEPPPHLRRGPRDALGHLGRGVTVDRVRRLGYQPVHHDGQPEHAVEAVRRLCVGSANTSRPSRLTLSRWYRASKPIPSPVPAASKVCLTSAIRRTF
jgi:hypothetical protein